MTVPREMWHCGFNGKTHAYTEARHEIGGLVSDFEEQRSSTASPNSSRHSPTTAFKTLGGRFKDPSLPPTAALWRFEPPTAVPPWVPRPVTKTRPGMKALRPFKELQGCLEQGVEDFARAPEMFLAPPAADSLMLCIPKHSWSAGDAVWQYVSRVRGSSASP